MKKQEQKTCREAKGINLPSDSALYSKKKKSSHIFLLLVFHHLGCILRQESMTDRIYWMANSKNSRLNLLFVSKKSL